MKLAHLKMSGFRGFRTPVEIVFHRGFMILDGRNGVGKSTVCDAIEFGLTGAISKYREAKADRESVADYIWWRGDTPAPDHYVELAFLGPEDKIRTIRRDRDSSESIGLNGILDLIVDRENAPKNALRQLCETLIIRDELIAYLSLDQTETARFQFLRAALGSIESDDITKRAQGLYQAGKRQAETAQEAVSTSRMRLTSALRRIDEARGTLADDHTISGAASALRTMFDATAPLDELASAVRHEVVALRRRISNLERLVELHSSYSEDGSELKR